MQLYEYVVWGEWTALTLHGQGWSHNIIYRVAPSLWRPEREPGGEQSCSVWDTFHSLSVLHANEQHTCMHKCIHTYTHAHTHAHTNDNTHACINAYILAHSQIHRHTTHTHTHTCTHTHTHTHVRTHTCPLHALSKDVLSHFLHQLVDANALVHGASWTCRGRGRGVGKGHQRRLN